MPGCLEGSAGMERSCITRRRIYMAALALLSLGAFWLMMNATRAGPEVNDDSILYVAAADNILAGNGFSWLSGGGEVKPITGFPPGYSVLVAAAGLTGADLFDAARWVNAILFGLTAFLSGWLIMEATGSGPAAAVGALLVSLNADLQLVYTWIMAEALFVPLLLLSALLGSLYLQAPRGSLAVLSGLVLSLAMLTRYVGVGLVPAALLVILLLNKAGWAKRVRDSAIVAAVAGLPFLILTAFNQTVVGSAYNRGVFLGWPLYSTLVTYLNSAFSWFVPAVPDESVRLRWKVLVLALILVVSPVLLYLGERRHGEASRGGARKSGAVLLVALILGLGYLAALAMGNSAVDVQGVHLQRYMAPLQVVWVILAVAVAHQLAWRWPGGIVIKTGAILLALFYLAWYGNQGLLSVVGGDPGLGRDDYRRANPATVETLSQLDPSRLIYTNEVYLFYYLTSRPSYRIPTRQDLAAEGSEGRVDGEYSLYRRRLAEGAYLVLFDSFFDQRNTFPDVGTLTEGLIHVAWIAEGSVFQGPGASY